MKKQIMSKRILLIVFVIFLGFGFAVNVSNLFDAVRGAAAFDVRVIERDYNEQFFMKKNLININGLVRKGLNQKLVNGTIKANDGQLYLDEDTEYVFNETKESECSQKALSILSEARENGATILYVQHAFKYKAGETELPYGLCCQVNQQYDYWCDFMNQNNIPTLDLRTNEKTSEFYKTDHHWTCESSYFAAQEIIRELHRRGAVDRLMDDYYKIEHYPNAFLGSEGVRTGEWYAGKDDFNVIVPKDSPIYHLEQIINEKVVLSKEGRFKEAFIDQSIIDDTDYYNKYNAFLYGGYVENIIINDGCDDESKLLLISDSFARSMSMYICQAFHETRYLDPQEGRYNESYIEYIKEYKPDIVVMMYTGDYVKE